MKRRKPAACAPLPVLLAGALLLVSTGGAGGPSTGSTGCGAPAPETPPDRIKVDGEDRHFILAVPSGYAPDLPHDLVLAFHGRTNSAERVRRYYDLEGHGERPTLFAYPRGLPAGEGSRGWWNPGDTGSELRDYRLFDAIVSRLSALYCIDPSRIFAVGHSLGASFVNSLGCARGEALRGIATVAGAMEPAQCRGEAAALLVHHPDDRLVPFSAGEAARDRLLAANALGDQAREPLQAIAAPPGFACVRWGPLSGHPVVWCPHAVGATRSGRDYPHQWPSGTGPFVMSFFGALQ